MSERFLNTSQGLINARFIVRIEQRPQGDFQVWYLAGGGELLLALAKAGPVSELLNGPSPPC